MLYGRERLNGKIPVSVFLEELREEFGAVDGVSYVLKKPVRRISHGKKTKKKRKR